MNVADEIKCLFGANTYITKHIFFVWVLSCTKEHHRRRNTYWQYDKWYICYL